MKKEHKELFDKRAYAWQVKQIPVEDFLDYENGINTNIRKSFYGRISILLATEIYSPRTAHLLNYIFNFKRWQTANWDFHAGGGFLIDNGIQVKIGKFNEVCFEMTVKRFELPYGAKNICVIKPKIYKMVKKAIREFIKEVFEHENVKTKKEIDDNGFIIKNVNIEEVEILSKYFNWEDLKNIGSNELIAKVFGKKNENQFAISACEVIENQIKDLIEERKIKIDEVKTRYSKIRDWIMSKWRNGEKAVEEEYKLKIEELENQLHQMHNFS